jgi:hypothetical protein
MERVDTVHLIVCCGRFDLMREVRQHPYYPTAYPYAGTIADNSQRQPTTANDTDSGNFGSQTTASDERQSIEENPKTAGCRFDSCPTCHNPSSRLNPRFPATDYFTCTLY